MLYKFSKLISVCLVLTVSTSILFSAKAAQAEPQQLSTEKDEYDFSWLDPDKKIYVVQNRKYTNAGRVEIAASVGLGIGEPYQRQTLVVPRLFYHINDTWALSVQGGFVSNNYNNNYAALKSVSSVIPTVRDVHSYVGGSLLWVPFYAKFNIFNKIVYVDWDVEAGVDSVSSDIDLNTSSTGGSKIVNANYTGFHWGTGQKFFITRNWAARLDFMALYYSAPTALNGVIAGSNSSNANYFLTIGASYTF